MPQKQKISGTEKSHIAELIERNELSITEAAKIYSVAKASVRSWIMRYRSEGASSFDVRSENRIYSAEIKRQAVEAYLSGKGSLLKICELFHISSKSILQRWLKVYNSGRGFTNKMSGGSRMKSTRKTTQEERIEIVKACIESDNNYGLIAERYGVSYQQVRTWTLKYKELGEAGLEDRRGKNTALQQPRTEEEALRIRVAQLERQLYFAEMENHVLKKLQEIERRDALDK